MRFVVIRCPMPGKRPRKPSQNASRKNFKAASPATLARKASQLVTLPQDSADSLAWWVEQYFKFEVTTAESSQAVQRRDLGLFVEYLREESGGDSVKAWTPRLSRAFQERLRKEIEVKRDGRALRRFSDRTINRVMAHLKTFSKWIHKLRPFPLGAPCAKIRYWGSTGQKTRLRQGG